METLGTTAGSDDVTTAQYCSCCHYSILTFIYLFWLHGVGVAVCGLSLGRTVGVILPSSAWDSHCVASLDAK